MANRSLAKRPPRGPAVGLEPAAGHYKTRLGGKESPWLPVLIWHGPILDPDTHQPLDRAWRLQGLIAGDEVDPWTIWPLHPITQQEYALLVAALGDDVRVKRDFTQEPPLF